MFKTFIATLGAVIIGGALLILFYEQLQNEKVSDALDNIEQAQLQKIRERKEREELAKEVKTNSSLVLCKSRIKKQHKEGVSFISVDRASPTLVAITYKAEGIRHHAQCFFSYNSNKMDNFRTSPNLDDVFKETDN